MVDWFAAAGCDALHTLDLPDATRTTDTQILRIAQRESRVVVTKNSDFVDSHILQGRPERLLLISTGNITHRPLETLMVPLIPMMVEQLQTCRFIELQHHGMILRGP